MKTTSKNKMAEEQKLIFLHKYGRYFKHLDSCNIMQNWDEAIQAMGDTPDKFRDESWHLAYNEMRDKMNTCTCGLEEVVGQLIQFAAQSHQVSDEEIEKWAAGKVNEINPYEYGYGDLLIEGARAMRDGEIQTNQ